MASEYVKTIDLFCSAEQAAIKALYYNIRRHYEVEVEMLEYDRHYRFYLYK